MFASLLDQVEGEIVPGSHGEPERSRQGVHVHHGNAHGLGDLREVRIDRDQLPPALARETDEGRVHVEHTGLLDEPHLDRGHRLELGEHVEPPPPAPTAARVGGVRDRLELRQDPLMEQQRPADEPGGREIGDPPVDQGAGVDDDELTRRGSRGPGLQAHEPEQLVGLRPSEPESERPEREVGEHDRGPRRGGRQAEQGEGDQRRHRQAQDHPDGAGRELVARHPAQLALHAADRAHGEPPDHAAHHVPDGSAEEHE